MSVYRWVKRKLGLRTPPRIIGPDGVVWQAPNGRVMLTVTATGGGGGGGIAVPPYPMTPGNCGVGSRVYHPSPSGGVGGGVAFPEDYIVRGQRKPAKSLPMQAVSFGQLLSVTYGSAGGVLPNYEYPEGSLCIATRISETCGLPSDCHPKAIDPTQTKQ